MKTYTTILNKVRILFVLLIAVSSLSTLQSQIRVPFTQRTSPLSNNQAIYNIQGDFQMIGNTNLTLENYGDNTNNSNPMRYVDVDGIPTTLNSSSATLTLPTGDAVGADPNCSNIIYAGLYWIGRAHNDNYSSNTFTVTKNNYPGAGAAQQVNSNFTVSHNNVISNSYYTMSVSRLGNNPYYLRYTFTSEVGGQPTVIFEFRNATPYIIYSTDGGTNWTEPANQVTTNNGNTRTTSFAPVTVFSQNNGITLTVNQLVRDSRTNQAESTYRSSARAGGNVSGTYYSRGNITKNFDKSVVSLKHASEASYTTFPAQDLNFTQNIYYPTNSNGLMYSAYAEVTEYVKTHGLGEYTVADIALTDGYSDNTGLFGGWGMIVVYENSKMKWRDITIFDGYAYINDEYNSNTMTYYELPVSGFNTAQNGEVRMKVGIIAGEGDRGIGGGTNVDNFSIRNHQDTQWITLSTPNNPFNNFFTSSIVTEGARSPNLYNNSGIDIVNVDVPTSALTNQQTSTKFRMGTNQDTYIIPVIAMAVDAYVPDMVSYISGTVNGQPITPTTTVQPNGEIIYTLTIQNPGNEDILDAAIQIPIPYTASYVDNSLTHTYHADVSGAKTVVVEDGLIKWTIGTLPKTDIESEKDRVLATLTFKLKATGDCFILVNDKCAPKVLVEGSSSGHGATSLTPFANKKFIHGYRDGACQDEPITGPLALNINATEYVNTQCGDIEDLGGVQVFNFCYNEDKNLIKFADIAAKFPAGTRFWSAKAEETVDSIVIVVPAEGATEYTASNNFLNNGTGTTRYYALPPTASTCYWEFDIILSNCNLWYGFTDTDWGKAGNWTGNVVPGENEDVIFATADNFTSEAINDLVLDINRRIGNLTNETESKKKVIIPVEKTLVVSKVANTGNEDQLVIKSQLTKGNGALIFTTPTSNLNVKATVEYDSKSTKVTSGTYPREWQYIGSPVQAATPFSVFGPLVSGSKYGALDHVLIRKYNESKKDDSDIGDKWDDVNVNTAMVPFAAYEVVQPAQGEKVYEFKGTLNVGNFNTGNLGFTSGVYYRGNYIIANSYVAPININKLEVDDFDNLERTIYLYNTGSRDQWLATNFGENNVGNKGTFYSVPVGAAPTLGIYQIPSLNGFMVRRLKNADVGYDANSAIQFNFNYSRLITDTATINSTPTQPMLAKGVDGNAKQSDKYPLLKVDVHASDGVDRVQLLTVPNTTKNFDNGWDGYKLRTQTDAQIYVLEGTDRFQVNSDSDLSGTILGFYNGTKESEFTLKFHFQDMDGAYNNLTITDLETGITSDITDGGSIRFSASAGSPEARFLINGKITTNVNDNDTDSPISISYDKAKKLSVMNSGNETGTISIYDVAGGLIYESAMPVGFTNKKINLKKGVFIIEAKTASYRNQIKVIAQ